MDRNEILNHVKREIELQVLEGYFDQILINRVVDATLKAINYSQCCTQLKDKKTIDFELWCKIKNIHHSFDDFYLWDKTLIEKEHVLRMYRSFTQSL